MNYDYAIMYVFFLNIFACDQVWHLNAFDVLFCKFRSAMKYLYGDTLHVAHDSHLSSMILRRI